MKNNKIEKWALFQFLKILLNQVCAGLWLTCDWFLEIAFVAVASTLLVDKNSDVQVQGQSEAAV